MSNRKDLKSRESQHSVGGVSKDDGSALKLAPGYADGTQNHMIIEEEQDSALFENTILKPSTIHSIWGTFKVKKEMFEYLTWYFRPRNSFSPIVELNVLDILAEY